MTHFVNSTFRSKLNYFILIRRRELIGVEQNVYYHSDYLRLTI